MAIEYTCSGGLRYVVKFRGTVATYWAVDQVGRVSNRNDNIPYRCREIRPGLIYAAFYEKSIGDTLFLVIDLEEEKIHSASLMGFPANDRKFQFEDATITCVVSND